MSHSCPMAPPHTCELVDKLVRWETRCLQNALFLLGLDKKNFLETCKLRTGQVKGSTVSGENKAYGNTSSSSLRSHWAVYIKDSSSTLNTFPPWLRPGSSVNPGFSWHFSNIGARPETYRLILRAGERAWPREDVAGFPKLSFGMAAGHAAASHPEEKAQPQVLKDTFKHWPSSSIP